MGTALSPPFFVLSDTHFYHDRIRTLARRPYDHEAMMVKRWRHAIKENATVLHLGDLFFGGSDGYVRFRSELTPKLTGKKYIILGNHDKKRYDYEELGFTVIKPFTMLYRGYAVSFDHYPRLLEGEHKAEKRLHVHGHIHNHPYAYGEPTRWGNINVSVEMIDYRPQRITRLLNTAIRARNDGKPRYNNSRQYRCQKTKRAA